MRNEILNKILIVLLVAGFLLSSFSFTRATAKSEKEEALVSSIAQAPIEVPKTLEEAREMAEKALETTRKNLLGILERIWEKEVLPIWQKMFNWFMTNIWSKIEGWFQKEVEPRIKEEIEKRKPIIEEEFRKEKEEIKEEAPKVGKSLWERFKELIK